MVITAGPTREPLDAVRFLSNYSTGYAGARLAEAALRRGHRVTLVTGPVTEAMPAGARRVAVGSSSDMEQALRRHASAADVVIMAAAVADFRAMRSVRGKLRRQGRLTLRLAPTPDIIGRLPRRPRQLVAGYAVETGAVVARAARKLRAKRLDLVVAQQAEPGTGAPFGRTRVRAWLLARRRPGSPPAVTPLGRISKLALAGALLDKIEAVWYGQPGSR